VSVEKKKRKTGALVAYYSIDAWAATLSAGVLHLRVRQLRGLRNLRDLLLRMAERYQKENGAVPGRCSTVGEWTDLKLERLRGLLRDMSTFVCSDPLRLKFYDADSFEELFKKCCPTEDGKGMTLKEFLCGVDIDDTRAPAFELPDKLVLMPVLASAETTPDEKKGDIVRAPNAAPVPAEDRAPCGPMEQKQGVKFDLERVRSAEIERADVDGKRRGMKDDIVPVPAMTIISGAAPVPESAVDVTRENHLFAPEKSHAKPARVAKPSRRDHGPAKPIAAVKKKRGNKR
jgi:hypothetical protein